METTTVPQEAPNADESVRRWFRLPALARRLYGRLRPSEPHVRTVWLILARPVGGIDTRIVAVTSDWRKADSYYQGAVADSYDLGGTHIIQLVPWLTTANPRIGDVVTGELAVAREFRP